MTRIFYFYIVKLAKKNSQKNDGTTVIS